MSTDAISQVYNLGTRLKEPEATNKDATDNFKIRQLILKIVNRDDGQVRFVMDDQSGYLIHGIKMEQGKYWWIFQNEEEEPVRPTDKIGVYNKVEVLE